MPKYKTQRGTFVPDDTQIIEAVADIGVALTTEVVRYIAKKQSGFTKPVTDTRLSWRREEDRVLNRTAIEDALPRLASKGLLVFKHGDEIPQSGPRVRRNANWKYYVTPEEWKAILDAQVAHVRREEQERAQEKARFTLAQRHPAEYDELVAKYLRADGEAVPLQGGSAPHAASAEQES